MYLGWFGNTGQSIIGIETKVVRCRVVKPMSDTDKWDPEMGRKIKWTPWQWNPDGDEDDVGDDDEEDDDDGDKGGH